MAGNDDRSPFSSAWYRNFLVKRKDNLRGQFTAVDEVRLDATRKLEMLMKEMKDIDELLAKCDKVTQSKSKGKGPKIGSNCDSPIQVDSDSDDEPVRMRRIGRFKGESSKSRGQCSNANEVKGVGVEGGEADMEISDEEAEVKQVIDSTVVVQAEEVQEQTAISEDNAGLVQQGQQQQQINQGRDLEEEEEDEEEEDEEQEDPWYGESKEDIGYPYHYHSPEVSNDDDGAYGFDSV